MSTIVGKGIISAGGGGELNIAYGLTPPSDTSKLWVRMQGKPDSVESTDDVAVQVGEFVEDFSSSDLQPLVGHVVKNAPSGRICNGKMYTATDENFNKFNVTDLETKITSLSSVQMPTIWKFPAWCVVGNKMYFLGGRPQQSANTNTVRIYDTETDMWTTHPFPGPYSGSSTGDATSRGSTAFYNNTIYVFGSTSNPTNSVIVYTFNIETYETSTITFTSSISATINSGNSAVQMFVKGKYAYLVFNPTLNTTGIRFNLEEHTYESFPFEASYTATVSNNQWNFNYANSIEVLNERYLFGFSTNSGKYYSALIKVTIGETSGTLDLVFNYTNQSTRINFIAGVTQNNMYAIAVSSIDDARKGWKGPYQYPLENGKLLLQEGDKSFRIINSKDAKISFKIKDTFLGKETGYADEVDAYLYNTIEQKWISLDGTPFGGGVTPEPTPTLEGTWVLNERLYPSQTGETINENISFTAVTPGGNYTGVKILVGNATTDKVKFYKTSGDVIAIYTYSTNGWTNDKVISQIIFPAGATASGDFVTWLAANATKQ